MDIYPGQPFPLGATYTGEGTNFAIFSVVAERIELCLFDDKGEETRVPLTERTGDVWHGFLPGLASGQLYGYRVYGPYDPERGLRCNPSKLLVDPYAKALEGELVDHPATFAYEAGNPDGPANTDDSAPYVPRSVVVNPYFDWGHDRAPHTPWHKTVIYEAHVRGMTALHPEVPEADRGTYRGLAHPGVIDYLKRLSVTAIELMPVHDFVSEAFLTAKGLRNAWGYNTLGYFAPHASYASAERAGEQVSEFKHMVKRMHKAGIEVIIDVVYNHTAEGNHLGPTLCFRGIDNRAYYRVLDEKPSRYLDFTGCGNSLNVGNPHVLQLIMDSLRYWIQEMHVDGFRFDLASALARELYDVDRLATFFQIIQQDPVISRVKLIAEPWDVGPGGYQVGNFPPQWSEWNGKYRDTVRDFWRGQDQTLAEFAYRFTGSSDLYASAGRRPHASINFVTCHDGFTLRDLVSYNSKHNEANLEDNRDGESHNRSWNCGHEGETKDPLVLELRARQVRNFLVTLFLSQGVPMLLAGDELGRTQGGNNNMYCHDNEKFWIDWSMINTDLLAFVQRLIQLREAHPVFRRRRWFEGTSIRGTDLKDIGWFRPNGEQMTDDDWRVSFAKSISVFLNGDGITSPSFRGEKVVDDSFLLLINAGHEPLEFMLPLSLSKGQWTKVIDTAAYEVPASNPISPGKKLTVLDRSIQVFWRERPLSARRRSIFSSPSLG